MAFHLGDVGDSLDEMHRLQEIAENIFLRDRVSCARKLPFVHVRQIFFRLLFFERLHSLLLARYAFFILEFHIAIYWLEASAVPADSSYPRVPTL